MLLLFVFDEETHISLTHSQFPFMQGVLLQIFTKPLGDRPTIFVEIIQRLCLVEPPQNGDVEETPKAVEKLAPISEPKVVATILETAEVGGCGGFGKGNFSELFKSIEMYESNLGIN